MENGSKITINIDEKMKNLFEREKQLQKEIEDAMLSYGILTRSRSNSIINSHNDENNDGEDTDTDSTSTNVESFFEENYEDITEMVHELIDEYMNTNVLQMKDPDFHEKMIDELELHIQGYFDSIALENISSSVITQEIKENMSILYDCFISSESIPPRSSSMEHLHDLTPEERSIDYLKNQLALLECTDQPDQRTPEWYAFRHNLISASNLWKVFGTPAMQNSLICEKCKPLETNTEPPKFVNVNSPLHWGVKYEQVTVMIYEALYKTKIGEFGCIQHPQYSFLGASPDGINIDPSSDKYGRMLEIKNIVNRDITGVPKLEYWVQTQIQMECCNLPLCDFMETRIKEYENSNDFYDDRYNPLYKGVVLHFSHKDMKNPIPKYLYMPLDIETNEGSINEWIDTQKQLQIDEHYVLVNTLYWYLDEYSCVVIQRNRKWFSSALPEIEAIWNTIEKERIEGFEHRRSKKRTPSLVIETITDGDIKILDAISGHQCVDVHKLDT
jgi:putative phage-type endonuclease